MNIKHLFPLPVVALAAILCDPTAGLAQSVLLSATGTYTKGASSVILVPGTSLATALVTVDGNIANGSAAASLTITSATVTLTGTNSYTGGTFVDAGVLNTGTANLAANGPVSLTRSSQLIFTQPADGAFGGVITGSGSLAKLGAGTLTLTGLNTYTGGTVVTAGTLVASTSVLPAAQNVSIASGGTLVFNQATDGTFSGVITGGGTIQKSGAGSLTMTNITSSAVNLQVGALYFNGGIGATTVSAGALLGGTGTISGNLVNNGTVSPGYSPGKITVAGNYTQGSTGILVIQLASGASFDQLVIGGTAALAGTLQVDLINGFYPVGQTYTFLTATGGVSGTFTTVNGTATSAAAINNPALRASVFYGPNSVTFAFVQASLASFGLTPNQRAIAAAAQLSPTLSARINVLPTTALFPVAFNALSPQGYEVWSDATFGHLNSLADRLQRDDGATRDHDSFYFDASQRRARTRSDLDVGATTFTTSSGLVGGDHVINPNLTAGVYFNYGETVSSLGAPGSRTSLKDKLIGARARWMQNDWFALGALAYGYDRYSSTRQVFFPGTPAVATSSTHGRQWFADLSAGRQMTVGAVSVSPFAGLLVSGWRADGFTETGAGAFNLTVADQSARSMRSQAGLDVQLPWNIGGMVVRPHARAAWLHEFANDARDIRASFDNVPFAISTRRPTRDSALFAAGLDLQLSPRALLYSDFTAQSNGMIKYLSEWRVGFAMSF